ncbi:MAG: hypothetical protein H7Z14_04415 [Anaerolineae bacterium]|nr:hypothetical protein [Phycisphaerae bacterium]
MKLTTLTLLITATGCVPAIDAEIALIEQSRRGVSMVRESIDSRRDQVGLISQLDRRRLDDAFDADVRQQPQITPKWVIEARGAYGVALDALHRRDMAAKNAVDADVDNLGAIDESLAELARLNRAQTAFLKPETNR